MHFDLFIEGEVKRMWLIFFLKKIFASLSGEEGERLTSHRGGRSLYVCNIAITALKRMDSTAK